MKLHAVAAGLLVGFALSPVFAKEEDAYVTFSCRPEATISHENTRGPSGQPLPIHFTDNIARVAVTRPGYRKQVLTVDKSLLSAEGKYPAEGPIVLQPEHFWVPWTDWISQNRVLSLASLLFLSTLGGLALVRSRKKQRREVVLGKFEARRDVHDSLALQTVGGYVLVEALGSGGMATVYRGLPGADLDEGKAVAVKVLSREMVDHGEFRERFRREVNAYRKLSHPNIVQVYDWGELEGGLIYITLELVQGKTVRAKMGGVRGLGADQVFAILEALASALEHAHQRGIIHRDLKPENLMLTDSGQLRVMDFGLARHEGEARLTKSDVIMGTPAYMAPEQLGGGPMDARLDQYAFGVIAYELLSRHLPYANEGGMALFADILSNAPVPLRGRNSAASAELEAVVMKMLSKSPGDRFASMAEAWQQLGRHLPGCP